MTNEVIYLKDESYQLVGACFEVYNECGFGLAEEIYQECLDIELEMRGISFTSKQQIECFYKKQLLQKKYVPDLTVFGSIIVELKAISQLSAEHEGQILNYMRISKSPLGYLMNFGKRGGLELRRFVLSEFLPR